MRIMPAMLVIVTAKILILEIFNLIAALIVVIMFIIVIPVQIMALRRMVIVMTQLYIVSALTVMRNINIVIPLFADKIDRAVTGAVLDTETPPVFNMLVRNMQI